MESDLEMGFLSKQPVFFCGGGREEDKVSEGCTFVSFLDLLKERNRRVFNDTECLDQQDIKVSVLYTFALWFREYREVHTLSLNDFIDWTFVK